MERWCNHQEMKVNFSTNENLREQLGLSYGYHGTVASETYPNPFFIKTTRELWKEFPNFMFLAVKSDY